MWNEIRNLAIGITICLCITAIIITCTVVCMDRDKEYIKQGYTKQSLPSDYMIVWTKN